MGGIGAILMVGVVTADCAGPGGRILDLAYLAFVPFFLLAAMQNAGDPSGFHGLGFAIMAFVALFRQGWFFRDSQRRAFAAAGAGSALLAPAAVYSIMVFGLATARFLSALAPRKQVLRLREHDFTERQAIVTLGWLIGTSARDLAEEHNISVNTVNSILCVAYHKLGLGSREALMAMGERYRIE